MKNNFDLKGYMKENKVGSYQQLNEMWYQDINQALGDFNEAKVIDSINEEEAVEEQDMEMEEGKKQLAFVIPCPDAYDIEEEAEHFQYLLDKAGVKAKVKANQVGEEAEVYTKDEKKARKVIEKNGYQIGWTEDNELEEMGGVKTIGDAGKMATPNSRPNLGRHRSSDMLDKMSKKDHKTNTVVGAKAAAYKAPHMKEEETADDIFAGSDTANWKDNYGNETSEWDTEIAGQTINGWTAEETQGGAIAWQNPRYPNADIYATPGWEGVDGIALELHDSEDGYMDEPKIQKVVGAGTDLWKTKEGYMALMAKVFTTLEKMLTPSEEMAEDDGTGRQINHDFNDDISIDHSEFEDTISEGTQDWNHTFEEDIMDLLDDGISKPEILTHFTDILKIARPRMEESIENEDADPFGSIKTGIDKITMGDDDMDMSDDDRFDQLGGDKIKAGIEGLMGDGFDYREILQFVKDTIASKRNY
jgi:hypothetical protein